MFVLLQYYYARCGVVRLTGVRVRLGRTNCQQSKAMACGNKLGKSHWRREVSLWVLLGERHRVSRALQGGSLPCLPWPDARWVPEVPAVRTLRTSLALAPWP